MSAFMERVNGVISRVNAIPSPVALRLAGLAVALPATIVLGLAVWLTPSPEGVGTHQQLGLSGCTMLTITGWPCPMCGMTTTFTHLAHLHVLDAVKTQPFGLVLFTFTVIFAVAGWIDVVTGRNNVQRVMDTIMRRERLVALLLLVGMLGGWAYKCVVMHPEVFHLGA
jgi:hypothetical protein